MHSSSLKQRLKWPVIQNRIADADGNCRSCWAAWFVADEKNLSLQFAFKVSALCPAGGSVLPNSLPELPSYWNGCKADLLFMEILNIWYSGDSGCNICNSQTRKEKNGSRSSGIGNLNCNNSGITEPLEFTFIFIARALFAVHAVLAATMATIMYAANGVRRI